MKVLWTIVTIFLLLFFLFTSPSTAAIKSINIRSDNRPMILFEKFGFIHTGIISITISNVSLNSIIPYDPSLVGFFLLSDETVIQLLLQSQRNPDFCLLDSNFVSILFTFKDIPSPQSSFHKSFRVTSPNEYGLFFANCNFFESSVTMDIRTEMYNIYGTTKDYLPAGLSQLPSLYFSGSLVYLCFLVIWISACLKVQQSAHWIHIMMGALLTTKAVSMFCAAEVNHHVKVTGIDHGWNIFLYTFQFMTSMLLLIVIVLIGAGLGYLKPFLLRKEKIVLIIVIGFQVLGNVASIMMAETGQVSKDREIWEQVYMWADVICYPAIMLPIGWSIRALNECRADVKACRNLGLFTQFYRLVIGYVLLYKGVGVFAMNDVTYEYRWVRVAADEVANLVLYLGTFYMFRPVGKSEYFILQDEEAAKMMGKG